jgi:hypothetical protein
MGETMKRLWSVASRILSGVNSVGSDDEGFHGVPGAVKCCGVK